MVALPDEVISALNTPTASKVLATVRPDGSAHTISVGSIVAPSPELVAFGAILMKESGKNLQSMKNNGQLVSILVTQETKSYQVRGKIKDYVTSGPLFDKMNENLKALGLKASGVWTIEPTDVWNQSASYEAGKKMA